MSPEEKEKAVADYQTGLTTWQIATKYGVTQPSIHRLLKRCRVAMRPPGTRPLFPLEVCLRIASEYAEGKTTRELGKLYGCAQQTISRVLIRCKTPGRDHATRNRRHTHNEASFDTITEESAYWVGFMMGDGCIALRHNRTPRVVLKLKLGDVAHVERFRTFLRSTSPIHLSRPFVESRLLRGRVLRSSGKAFIDISSPCLAASLARFGVVPLKTGCERVLVLENNPHFWRGLIDADGSLGWGLGYPLVELYGSETICEQFRSFVERITGRVAPSARVRPGVRQVRIASVHQTLPLVRALYENCTVALYRKHAIARSIMGYDAHD